MSDVLEIVAIYRRCETCGQVKPLDHFLKLFRSGRVRESAHVCAACRAHRQTHMATEYERIYGSDA